MAVLYNISYKYKDDLELEEDKLKDKIEEKLLRIILSLENKESETLNNS